MGTKIPTLLIALLAFISIGHAAVDTGSSAPDFTLTDTAGVTHKLSDYKGKFVVLEWTNHQCPFVVKHYSNGDMQATQKLLTEDGVIWLQVVTSEKGKQGYLTNEEGEALRSEKGMHSTAMLFDTGGKVARMYGARTTPHMFMVNPEGLLVYQGAIDSIKSTRVKDISTATNYVKAAYQSAKAGEPIAEATTTPYGCGVKY
ncbi:MAG: redoxin domain-containing protein [Opitutales bacterium]|jgi:hypothetical protein|nr:redoxin domain-containing protein [Opitutales bacterium]MDP5080543.1 redoxin domain-containing protein [Opitutales bacterium]